MKADSLHDMWAGPDNSRLVSKQFSFRLPVHIAAKIAALGEMYPTKNRTQIVADLLTTALDDLEKNLPMSKGKQHDPDPHGMMDPEEYDQTPYFVAEGVRPRFRELTNKHYLELEKDLGNENPGVLFGGIILREEEFKK
jgi:hypothetical protein